MRLVFSKEEKKDIIKAWTAIAVAFGILETNNFFSSDFLINFFISFITAGIGFLFHELAHKYVAQKYKYFAEFKADNKMLLIAIASSFFGFLFAAPGGVVIEGGLDKRKYALIAGAGPLLNIIIAILFLGLSFVNLQLVEIIALYGFSINSWLALFNLIPFFPFDGGKIVTGNKVLYFSLLISSFILMFLSFFIK